MESPECIPSLNLEGVSSDLHDRTGNDSGNDDCVNREKKSEVETQTYAAAMVTADETHESKSSFELLEMFKTPDEESLSSSSSCFSSRILRESKKSKIVTEWRLKRHRTENSGLIDLDGKESTTFPVSVRSSNQDGIDLGMDRYHSKSDDFSLSVQQRRKTTRASTNEQTERESIIEENKRLKEALLRERRHHTKEKNRIREVLFAIDEALSSLPSRLGKIRIQNQKNLLKMNSIPLKLLDRGDFEMILGSKSKCNESTVNHSSDSKEVNVVKRAASIQMSEDVFSEVSHPRGNKLVQKMRSLNNLIEELKKGQPAPIETVLNNELCAISLLKNEIKYTKRKIEKSKTDSESAIVTNWQAENHEASNPKQLNGKRVDSEEVKKMEKYILLQKEAISVLSMEAQRAKEMFLREMKEKKIIETEKKALMTEIAKLKSRDKDGSQRNDRQKGEPGSMNRPFRMIKELRSQLEEKEKMLANSKAKISRLEAAAVNKGNILENEKKKNSELESKFKILAKENKSLFMQINSLQFINNELKEQMEILKNQIDILIRQNSEAPDANAVDLKKYFNEVTEILKNEDTRLKALREESEKKLQQLQDQHSHEMDLIKTSFEKSEKMNFEYLRTFKALLISIHNYDMEKNVKLKRKNSYGRVKEILGITEMELEDLFGGNFKDSSEKELEDLYEQCNTFVNDEEDTEFSSKLSTWFFDLIKQKMVDQNSCEIASE